MTPFLFIGGQLAILAGVFLLARLIPWPAALGVWLLVEGVITVIWSLLNAHGDSDAEPWHGRAAVP